MRGFQVRLNKAGQVRASAAGKAFVYNACPTPEGTPEKAVEDKTCGLGFGNHVRILHQNGYVSFYAHLAKITVKNGQKVKAGQVIGTDGWTGDAGSRALHWGVDKLSGQNIKDWESTLSHPGWGGESVPFNFKVSIAGHRQVLNSKNIKCKWNDMTQAPWRGTK
jgi:murein DD-endopeptidase MepM/ murein hydrolase activator NlpD